MSQTVILMIGCAVLIFFIMGAVCGVHWANGRAIPWSAKSRHQAAAEALVGQMERLRDELSDVGRPVITGRVEGRTALPRRANPALTRRASHWDGR
jgi:uncharacterized membrane protein